MSVGDMLGYAVGVLGLSPNSFYDLTPAELISISNAYTEHKMQELDILGAIVYQAVGLAFNGKPYKPMFDKALKDNKPKTKKITPEEKAELLQYMSSKFNL